MQQHPAALQHPEHGFDAWLVRSRQAIAYLFRVRETQILVGGVLVLERAGGLLVHYSMGMKGTCVRQQSVHCWVTGPGWQERGFHILSLAWCGAYVIINISK
jgi:hypothetical protein